jgi:hypothetical protein
MLRQPQLDPPGTLHHIMIRKPPPGRVRSTPEAVFPFVPGTGTPPSEDRPPDGDGEHRGGNCGQGSEVKNKIDGLKR